MRKQSEKWVVIELGDRDSTPEKGIIELVWGRIWPLLRARGGESASQGDRRWRTKLCEKEK